MNFKPYISPEQNLSELTLKSFLFGCILAALMVTSNVYIGLKIGTPISGSISAAVLSMLFLKKFSQSSILEHNIIQTTASASDAVSGGFIFTIPALVMIGFWHNYNYVESVTIITVGIIIGITMSIPLRRIMVTANYLPYPEGIAVAEIIKGGTNTKASTELIKGGLFAAGFSFLQSVLQIFVSEVKLSFKFLGIPFAIGAELSPALLSAGYIVGPRVIIPITLGNLLIWCICIPIYRLVIELPYNEDTFATTFMLWKTKLRFIGVGGMIVGSLWSVISLSKSMLKGLLIIRTKKIHSKLLPRTELDIPNKFLKLGIVLIVLGISILFFVIFSKVIWINYSMILVFILATLLLGYISSTIGSYLVGITGVTAFPTSGVILSAIILFFCMFIILFGDILALGQVSHKIIEISALVIVFGALMAITTSIAADNMQDLKAGYILGATPYKQQLMLLCGGIVSALVAPLVIEILYQAYGIGDSMPRSDMNPKHALLAPQATLIATIVPGFLAGKIEWQMLLAGIIISLLVLIINIIRKNHNTVPIMPFAVGMYLPMIYVVVIALGGIIRYLVIKNNKYKVQKSNIGILYASGMVAGQSLVGVVTALLIINNVQMLQLSLPYAIQLILSLVVFSILIRPLLTTS